MSNKIEYVPISKTVRFMVKNGTKTEYGKTFGATQFALFNAKHAKR